MCPYAAYSNYSIIMKVSSLQKWLPQLRQRACARDIVAIGIVSNKTASI